MDLIFHKNLPIDRFFAIETISFATVALSIIANVELYIVQIMLASYHDTV